MVAPQAWDNAQKRDCGQMEQKDPAKILKAFLTDKLGVNPVAGHLKINLTDSALTVEGITESVALKKKTLLFAMSIDGVDGVVDRLRVKPSKRMSDDEIKVHVYHSFSSEPTLRGSSIEAEIKDGVIDIEGVVGSLTHKRLAGVLAWWVPGTMDVINSLEVEPPEQDTDDEIADALKIIFDKDSLIDAGAIKISTRNCVVTLEGTAKSEAEKDAAEEDAWYTWGVNDVINRINVETLGRHRRLTFGPLKA